MKKIECSASEEQIQMAFVEWLNLNKIVHWHTPNGGKRNVREAAKFKKMGVVRGVPDMFIPMPNRCHHGLFIELKSAKGKLTPAQKYWLEHLTDLGYCAVVASSLDEAISIVTRYKAQGGVKIKSGHMGMWSGEIV